MTEEEYQQARRELINDAEEDIYSHLDAGEYGDADNCRKALRYKLEQLKRDYINSNSEGLDSIYNRATRQDEAVEHGIVTEIDRTARKDISNSLRNLR